MDEKWKDFLQKCITEPESRWKNWTEIEEDPIQKYLQEKYNDLYEEYKKA